MPSTTQTENNPISVVPQGTLLQLTVSQIKPSTNNPRLLFDRLPLSELKENIRHHGVLVPITVYQVTAQNLYSILDGERRYRCCKELEEEGLEIKIPANVVEPPNRIAGLLYMFSIHNFREQWELMPTALSLQTVMDALGEQDTKILSKLTGLSEPQIERCKVLLSFPKRFQDLSLEPDPNNRIPSNFWTEANPVLDLVEQTLPQLVKKQGRDGITDKLVEKYRVDNVKSVIHFRRIIEAYEITQDDKETNKRVINRLAEYINDVDLETRKAFDEFVVDNRRIQGAVKACEDFISQMKRFKIEHIIDKDELIASLNSVKIYVEKLLQSLEGSDSPDSRRSSRRDSKSKH
jgi:ParB family chromosome partitioning protein